MSSFMPTILFLLALLAKDGTGSVQLPGSACEENELCSCHGTAYYGRKYVESKVGIDYVTSLAQMKQNKHMSKELSGKYVCSLRNFRQDPAPGNTKHCLCDPAEVLDQPLCANDNGTMFATKSFRVAVGFYGMSYNLRVSLPTFRKHIFNVLERNGITFDVFASIALQENSSKNIKRKSSFECDEYEMRLMRPCAVTITPMVNILKAITKQMSLDDERQEIYVFTRRNLLTMMLTYARVHGVQYNAILALQPHNAVTADFDLPILLRSHTFSLLDLYVPSVYDSNDRAAFGSRDIMEVYLGCRSELDEQYLNILDGDCNNDTSQYQVIKSEMNIVGIKPQKGLPSFDAIPSPAPLSKRLCAKLNNRRGEPLARIAIGFYGLSRNLRLTLPSFKKHVFDVFDRHDIAYDVFWSAVTAPILVSNRSNEWHIEVDEYDVRLMRPCIASLIPMYQVLNETEFNFSHISPHYHYRDGFSSVRNIFCSLHTQKILDRTIRSYSAANNLVYDAVVTLRPDTAVVRDIDLASMLVKKKFSKKHIYLPNFAHFKGVNDRSAYGSPAVMSTYLNRDLAFKISLSTNTNKWIYNTETFLKNYLKEMNIPVIKSTVRVIRVRADGRVPAYDSNEVVMYMPKKEIQKCQMSVNDTNTGETFTVLDTTIC